jgi:hypothetical protein
VVLRGEDNVFCTAALKNLCPLKRLKELAGKEGAEIRIGEILSINPVVEGLGDF